MFAHCSPHIISFTLLWRPCWKLPAVSSSCSPSTCQVAFDIIDFLVLKRWLKHTIGVKGTALSWIKSYLDGRSCHVKISSATWTTRRSDTGVPYGSVLGLLLVSLFTAPLGNVILRFGIIFHQYADDMHIYLAVNNVSFLKEVLNLAGSTNAVYERLLNNSLALNPDKS